MGGNTITSLFRFGFLFFSFLMIDDSFYFLYIFGINAILNTHSPVCREFVSCNRNVSQPAYVQGRIDW